MARYGLPYMGSKNKIAEWVLSYLPQAYNFYDLFCGGCAITHCAITQRKYKNYFINDIKKEMPQAFIDCINGKYNNDYRWISHENFDKLKGKGDLLVDICFSFGNNWRKGYAYSREIEPYKKALHYAIFFNDYSLAKEMYGIDFSFIKSIVGVAQKYAIVKKSIKDNKITKCIQLETLERLQNLERLHRMYDLQNLERLQFSITPSSLSYNELEIKPNSVIYCDIPYRSTAKYNDIEFDYDKFYEWCLKQTEPLFISEYDMPKGDFVCVGAKNKVIGICATDKSSKAVEKIFVPKHQVFYKPLTLFDL